MRSIPISAHRSLQYNAAVQRLVMGGYHTACSGFGETRPKIVPAPRGSESFAMPQRASNTTSIVRNASERAGFRQFEGCKPTVNQRFIAMTNKTDAPQAQIIMHWAPCAAISASQSQYQ